MDLPSVDPFKPSDELLWANAGLDSANTAAIATIESFIAVTSCCCTINKPCKEFKFHAPAGSRPACVPLGVAGPQLNVSETRSSAFGCLRRDRSDDRHRQPLE